jgi:hypothetical protein
METRTSVEEAKRSKRGDEKIALSDVPAHVKAAALAAVPGLVLTDAETEFEDGVMIYSLTGNVAGKRHEVEIKADGTVGEIEADDDSTEASDHDDADDDGDDDADDDEDEDEGQDKDD